MAEPPASSYAPVGPSMPTGVPGLTDVSSLKVDEIAEEHFMKLRTYSLLFAAFALSAAALVAQDSGAVPAAGQNAGQNSGQNAGPGSGGGYGRRGGGMGRGIMGTVTDVAADHYTIKTDAGDVFTVHFDSNTRMVKQPAGMGARGQRGGEGGGGGQGSGGGQGGGQGAGGGMGRSNPPEQIKATDIKAGDIIRATGDADATKKTISATSVMQLDPATVLAMREMQANFGKTWLMGKVTAIDGTKITLTGSMDNAPHTAIADENTTFRKRRDPVTLADIQVGDTVRVDGALKDGVFSAATVSVGGMTGGGEGPNAPRNAPQP
jgi:hypothetical protein